MKVRLHMKDILIMTIAQIVMTIQRISVGNDKWIWRCDLKGKKLYTYIYKYTLICLQKWSMQQQYHIIGETT